MKTDVADAFKKKVCQISQHNWHEQRDARHLHVAGSDVIRLLRAFFHFIISVTPHVRECEFSMLNPIQPSCISPINHTTEWNPKFYKLHIKIPYRYTRFRHMYDILLFLTVLNMFSDVSWHLSRKICTYTVLFQFRACFYCLRYV